MLKRSQIAGALLLAGTLFLVGGCGYKSKPVPPDSIVPVAIDDLRYSVSENGVSLNWTFPKKTIMGTDLTDITSFDIYRAAVPLSDYCSTCPIPFQEAVRIPGGLVDRQHNRQGTYETTILSSGHKYFFKVLTRTSWWAASADSNIVSFVWHTPAEGAEGLTVKVADSSATISWQPVTMLTDGQAVDYPLMYQVLRSKDKSEFAAIGEATAGTQFTDKSVVNGETYYYQVQSILMVDDNPVSGGLSGSVSATPVDLTPPAPPAGVTAVQTAKGIKIFWEKSPDADVKGYRVYRRSAAVDVAELIGDVPAIRNIFEDINVPVETKLYYSVTAYDQMETPNESMKSREASIRH
jgi:hypothetical protein